MIVFQQRTLRQAQCAFYSMHKEVILSLSKDDDRLTEHPLTLWQAQDASTTGEKTCPVASATGQIAFLILLACSANRLKQMSFLSTARPTDSLAAEKREWCRYRRQVR
jgi:hypothetical protein